MPLISLERIVPEEFPKQAKSEQETLDIHLARYFFASQYALPGRLLDIACGVGYGTQLLAKKTLGITEAIGVDLSHEAIDYALKNYSQYNTHFIHEDATKFVDRKCFDTIVSLETIEHLPHPLDFLHHILQFLKPGGVFIGSVPTTPSVDLDRKSTRLNSSHTDISRMPSSA